VPRTAAVTLAAAVFAALAIVAAPLSAGPGPRNVVTAMAGVEETQAADTDSYGSTAIEVTTTNQVCFRAIAKRAGTITAGHIHRGRPGVPGPIVVTLFNGAPPTAPRTCRQTSAALASEILSNPARFYVNVHSRAFPDGAIRGQLTK
jgi:CHRD domain